jgi:hypothetical protein
MRVEPRSRCDQHHGLVAAQRLGHRHQRPVSPPARLHGERSPEQRALKLSLAKLVVPQVRRSGVDDVEVAGMLESVAGEDLEQGARITRIRVDRHAPMAKAADPGDIGLHDELKKPPVHPRDSDKVVGSGVLARRAGK